MLGPRGSVTRFAPLHMLEFPCKGVVEGRLSCCILMVKQGDLYRYEL